MSDRHAPARRGACADPPGARARPGLRAFLAVLACLGAQAVPVLGADTDSLRLRVEVGAGTDLTNERYYEDAFIDTTFLGRQLVGTPETRNAGILLTVLQGTRGGRASAFTLQNELSLGDRVRSDALSLHWKQRLSPDWTLVLTPAAEWRHDRTFGRDQEERRAAFRGRLRRSLGDGTTAAELATSADLLRASGAGATYLLDRNGVRAGLALDHLGLLGGDWRLGYSLASRVFPDSGARDHLEHGWEGRWRQPFTGGHALTVETTGQRRQTHRIVTTSRDNFWQEQAALDGEVRVNERWLVRARLEGEALQYDLEDGNLFFDYQVARARLAVRLEGDGRWSLAVGPRGELLESPRNPAEEYREIAGAVELEVLGRHAWWHLVPAAGWRAYEPAPLDGLPVALHSSYAFYELDGFFDQPLPGRVRLRGLAALRHERHQDRSQDATSLYLSLQLRWSAF